MCEGLVLALITQENRTITEGRVNGAFLVSIVHPILHPDGLMELPKSGADE